MLQANTVAVPVLYRAQLHTHTGNDNKDHDTGTYVIVRTAAGGTQIASWRVALERGFENVPSFLHSTLIQLEEDR